MGQWLTADSLLKLPFLLAGPILRRVEPNSVTVWVALKEKAKVNLQVFDKSGAGTALMTGQRDTIAVGTYLHVVAVTARAGTKLTATNIYTYNVSFDFDKDGHKTLVQAAGLGSGESFAYAPFSLPSFSLPPTTIQDCRLIHGSCRKPHGEGLDALPILDDLIRDTASDATQRPHQLLLAGDQIYADDVAHGLLLMLTDVGDTLLGWTEELPMPGQTQSTFHAADWGPQTRSDLIQQAHFTTDDMRCHLMSLGEYFAMYLFVWSNVLWPAVLPIKTDFSGYHEEGAGAGSRAGGPGLWSDDKLLDFLSRFDNETKQIDNFRKVLGLASDKRSVRRALANVPTAMICDDHEVTDDWNMTRGFCDGVYGDPLAFRVVQNALTAYAVCQAWGNTPEQFENDPNNPAGLQLLTLLDGTTARGFTGNSPWPWVPRDAAGHPNIATLVGMHDARALAAGPAPYRVFHESGKYVPVQGRDVNDTSIDYHYAIDSDAYKIIVTDSRSWRSFPEAGAMTHADLIEPSMMSRQLGNITPRPAGSQDLGNRLLIVILTTNFPPIKSIRVAAGHPILGVYEHDLYDSWELPSRAFDQLIVEITKLFPPANPIQGRVVFLSGDVHFSFASRLAYRAETRLGMAPLTANLIAAQLVGSALQNETDDTRGEQTSAGYKYTPHWYTDLVAPPKVPNGCAGWNYQSTAKRSVGIGRAGKAALPHPLLTALPAYDFTDLYDWAWLQKPDFRYRLDYLVTSTEGAHLPSPPVIPPASGSTDAGRAQGLKNMATAAKFGTDYFTSGGNPDCVGHNNLGEITFYLSGSDLGVRYKLRCHAMQSIDEALPTLFFAYEILLKLDETMTDGKTLRYPFFQEPLFTP